MVGGWSGVFSRWHGEKYDNFNLWLVCVSAIWLQGWGSRDPPKRWLEIADDMTQCRGHRYSCIWSRPSSVLGWLPFRLWSCGQPCPQKPPDLNFALLEVYHCCISSIAARVWIPAFKLESVCVITVPPTPVRANQNFRVRFVLMSSPMASNNVRQPRTADTIPVSPSPIESPPHQVRSPPQCECISPLACTIFYV